LSGLHLYPERSDNGTGLPISIDRDRETTDRAFLATLPDIEDAIAREAELETLTQWVLEDECRVIGLWGLPNVGKSILAAQLIDRVADSFAVVIWRTLTADTDTRILIEDLNTCLSRNTPTLSSRSHNPLTQLCDRWRIERCLIVLDGLDSAFVSGTWAGTWQSDRAEIAQLIDLAVRCRHPSCLIVTSREIPIDWAALETKYKRT
jgi:hypothetical protein